MEEYVDIKLMKEFHKSKSIRFCDFAQNISKNGHYEQNDFFNIAVLISFGFLIFPIKVSNSLDPLSYNIPIHQLSPMEICKKLYLLALSRSLSLYREDYKTEILISKKAIDFLRELSENRKATFKNTFIAIFIAIVVSIISTFSTIWLTSWISNDPKIYKIECPNNNFTSCNFIYE